MVDRYKGGSKNEGERTGSSRDDRQEARAG